MEDIDTLRRDVDAIMRYLTKIDPLWNSNGSGGMIPPVSPSGWITPRTTDGANIRSKPEVMKETFKYTLPYGQSRKVVNKTLVFAPDESAFFWYTLEDGSYVRDEVVTYSAAAPIVPVYTGAAWPSPVASYKLTSRHGIKGHHGYDLSAAMGASVMAGPYGGTVVKAQACPSCNPGGEPGVRTPSTNGGFGNNIVMRYDAEMLPDAAQAIMGQKRFLFVMHAHLSRIDVAVGQTVTGGQIIGAVGSTGDSSGAHLHLECRFGGDGQKGFYGLGTEEIDPALIYAL